MGRQRTLDLAGQKFNFLLVIERSESNPRKWKCLCDCGNYCETTPQRLRNGASKSCGCMKLQLLRKRFTLHGAAGKGENNREYQSYVAMLHRCYDESRFGWDRYGGRGIVVEEISWLEESPNGFLNFLKDMGKRPEGMSLDRINSDDNYSKENCRWSTRSKQAYNTTRTKKSTNTSSFRGVSYSGNRSKKWVARIGNGSGGYIWIGQYDTEIEAALAYNQKAIELHGDDAILNVVENYEVEDLQ